MTIYLVKTEQKTESNKQQKIYKLLVNMQNLNKFMLNLWIMSWYRGYSLYGTKKKIYVYEFKSGEERYLNIFHKKYTMSMI